MAAPLHLPLHVLLQSLPRLQLRKPVHARDQAVRVGGGPELLDCRLKQRLAGLAEKVRQQDLADRGGRWGHGRCRGWSQRRRCFDRCTGAAAWLHTWVGMVWGGMVWAGGKSMHVEAACVEEYMVLIAWGALHVPCCVFTSCESEHLVSAWQ